jgi:hypothetical protein
MARRAASVRILPQCTGEGWSVVSVGEEALGELLLGERREPERRTRRLVVAGLVTVVGLLSIGPLTILQFAHGLQGFGGLEYVPRVVGLGVLRFDGANAAAGATCVLLTGLLHARPEAAQLTGLARLKAAGLAAVCVPVLYVPAVTVILTSFVVFARLAYGLPAHAFFEGITVDDYRCGAVYAALFSMAPAAWFLFGRRIWAASRGLAFKLVALYLIGLAIRVAMFFAR